MLTARPATVESASAQESPKPPVDVGGPPAMRVIDPAATRVRLGDVRGMWPVIWALAVRDFMSRYKQSVLGPLWILLRPLALVTAFTVIFDGVADVDSGGVPYPLFAVVGVAVWTFFQACLVSGVRVFLANKDLVKRVPCPRLAMPLASLVAAVPELVVVLVLALVGAVVLASLQTPLLALPLLVLWLAAFALALLLIVAPANVKYRDVGSAVPFALQGGLFLSPVGYPTSEVPDAVLPFFIANPLTGLIEAFRWSFLGTDPYMPAVVVAGVWTIALLAVGWRVFVRTERTLADVI